MNTDQKNIFRNLSIKQKLVFIIMLTSGATLLIASLAFVGIDLIHMRRSLTDELFSQAEILAYNSTAALAFNDKNTAKTILSALKYRQSIVSACIYDKEGKVFAVYHRDQPTNKSVFQEPDEDRYRFESWHLHLYHRIVLDDEELGTVYIRSDLSQIESTLKQYSLIGAFVIIIAAVVALILSHKLQRVISVPVIQLATIARMISREKNYSVRAEKLSEDELGDLVEAFNEMLIQIQERDTALRSERDYSTGIITGTPAIICRIAPDGITTFVNPAAEKITGYSAEEHIGQNWWQIHYPGDEYKQVENLFREFEEGDVRDYEMVLTTKSGDKRTILWNSINRYDESDQLIEIISVGNDITERKQAEEELHKHRDHLEDLVAERTTELTRSNEQLQQEINVRKRAVEQIKKLEEYLRLQIERMPIALIVWDTEFRVQSWNPAAEKIFGFTETEALGKHPYDLIVPKEAKPHVDNIWRRLLEGDMTAFSVNENITKDGRTITCDWSNTPLKEVDGTTTGVLSMTMDISERKRMEEELRESEERFRTIAKTAKDAIIMMDNQGNISYWNPEAEKMFGQKRNEALGKELHSLLVPVRFIRDYRKGFIEFRKTGKGKAVGKTLELIGVKKNGCEFPIELSLSAIQIRNQWHAFGIARDITERKQAEKELKRTIIDLHRINEELNAAQIQLVQSEKMASLGMLVAGIAHEINTPIGAVNSMHNTSVRAIQKLRDNLKSICEAECLDNKKVIKTFTLIDEANRVIETGTERVTTIVRRLRSFARLDEAELKEADLHEGLEDTLVLIHHEIKYNIEIVRKYGEIPSISCYPGRLNQVFLNILINGKQAIRGKGIITISTHQVDGKVYIEFADTGVGIPKAKLSKIFDPGFTTKGVGVGTGLGLSICYQIIQDHHGEIRVESNADKGTTFTIILPTNLDEILNGS